MPMVIDTSAVLAILPQEPEAAAFAVAIRDDPVRLTSAVSLLECAIAVESKLGASGGRELDLLLHKSRVEVVSFDRNQAELARSAWERYGRGRHPARLNFGDCCSHALAKTCGEKLLFKGDDFSQTDSGAALAA